jgi:Mce-associated membrane protein
VIAAMSAGTVISASRAARRLFRDPVLAVATVLAAAAVIFAAQSGYSWYSAARAGTPALAQTRDLVLQAGEQEVQNFNTLDYRHVSAGLNLWEQSSAGSLRAQIIAARAQFEQQVEQAKTVTTARIIDAALVTLNIRAGTASIIAAVQLNVVPSQGAPVSKQARLLGQLTRTAAGWKLTALGQAPVGAAAASQPAG